MNFYVDFFRKITHNVAVYFAVMLTSTLATAAYTVLFGIYLKNMGIAEDQVGQILSLKTLGIAVGAVGVAVLSVRINKKRTMQVGLWLMCISSFVMLNVPQMAVMAMASFTFGIGNATVMVLQGPILYDNTDEPHRVTAFSLAFVIQNIAFVIGSLVLGHLSEWFSRSVPPAQANLIVLNGATALMFVAIVLSRRFKGAEMLAGSKQKTPMQVLGETIEGYRSIAKGRTALYLVQVALTGIGAGMIVPFFSMYLKYMLSIEDGTVGLIMAISQIGTILGGLAVPALVRKMGAVKTVILCQLLSIPFLLSISFPQGIVLVGISFFFRSALMNMVNPVIRTLGLDIVDEARRTHMSSMVSFVNNLFRALGIFLGGVMMYRFGYNSPYYLTIMLYLLGTGFIYRAFGTSPHKK